MGLTSTMTTSSSMGGAAAAARATGEANKRALAIGAAGLIVGLL